MRERTRLMFATLGGGVEVVPVVSAISVELPGLAPDHVRLEFLPSEPDEPAWLHRGDVRQLRDYLDAMLADWPTEGDVSAFLDAPDDKKTWQPASLPSGETPSAPNREAEVDALLANFQRACEIALDSGTHRYAAVAAATKERAILRNDLRARLLAAPSGAADGREPSDPALSREQLDALTEVLGAAVLWNRSQQETGRDMTQGERSAAVVSRLIAFASSKGESR